MGRYPSGQRGQTVNLLPSASKVRTLACPPCLAETSRAYSINDEDFKWCCMVNEKFCQWNRVNKKYCGRSSVVEFQPSKLAVVGSNPIARSNFVSWLTCWWVPSRSIMNFYEIMARAHVAQLVEHVLGKDEVTRSIRVVGSIYIEF